MNQHVQQQLIAILDRLSRDCQMAINPSQCILEPTKKKHHFRVPNPSAKQVIAWGNLRSTHSTTFGSDGPCVIVGVDALLLNNKDPEYVSHHNKNAKYKMDGDGLVQIPVVLAGSKNYQLALRALIESSRNLISVKRYSW